MLFPVFSLEVYKPLHCIVTIWNYALLHTKYLPYLGMHVLSMLCLDQPKLYSYMV